MNRSGKKLRYIALLASDKTITTITSNWSSLSMNSNWQIIQPGSSGMHFFKLRMFFAGQLL